MPRDPLAPPLAPPCGTMPQMQPDTAFDEWREWSWLVDAGLIPNRNPPPSPEVVAIRDANDALFRSFRRRR